MTFDNPEQQLRYYQGEYANSQRWRKNFESRWRTFVEVYRHRDPMFCGEGKKDRIQVNYIHSTCLLYTSDAADE